MKKWARHLYQPNLPLYESGRVTCSDEHIALSLKAAEEGMVLLKNEDSLLPLRKGTKLALFGKGTFDYVKGGGGSGDVFTKYIRNIYEGLKEVGLTETYEPLNSFYKANVEEQYKKGIDPTHEVGDAAIQATTVDFTSTDWCKTLKNIDTDHGLYRGVYHWNGGNSN